MSLISTIGTAELACNAERALRTNGRPSLSWPRYWAEATRSRSGAFSTSSFLSRKLTSCLSSSGEKKRKARTTPISAGSASLRVLTTRSWLPPGTAQRRLIRRSCSASSDMGENVLLGPAGQIEQGALGQEVEAGLSEAGAALAREPFVELLPERMEIADVGRGIILLRVAQF